MVMKRALVLLLMGAVAIPAEAQLIQSVAKSSAKGLMMSASGQVGYFQFENERSGQRGAGVAAMVGWGFTPTYAVVVTGSRATFEYDGGSYDAEQIAVGARIHMTNSQWRWVPYIELAFGPRSTLDENGTICGFAGCTQGQLKRSGVVFAQTVGVSFYPTRRFALTAAGHVNAGQMTATFDGQEVFSSQRGAQDLRLSMGATWVIGGGR
jgi:hypothetical protein